MTGGLRTAALAAVLLMSAAPLSTSVENPTPTVALAPPTILDPQQDGPLVDWPVMVDEDGDVMTGDLGFSGATGIQFGGGKLVGNPALMYGINSVCLSNVAISGCGTGDISAVNAGPGLVGGGLFGDVTLSVDSSLLQIRVNGQCPANSSIRAVASDGSVTCESDTDTTYTAGDGLDLTGTNFRLASCASGQILKRTATNWACATDADSGGDITGVTAGTGLSGGGASGAVTLSIATAGVTSALIQDGTVGTADLAFDPATQGELDTHKASSDHDARYYTKTDADGRFLLANYTQDVQYATNLTVTATDAVTTVVAITTVVPDKCPGAEGHNYLVDGQAYVSELSGASLVRAWLTRNTTSVVFDETLRLIALDSTAHDWDSYATRKVFTNVSPGSQVFRLMADSASGVYDHGRASLTVQHLGWTCA